MKQQIAIFRTMLSMYDIDNGSFPTTEQGLQALIERPAAAPQPERWNRYLDAEEVPHDAWGHDYLYRSDGRRYQLRSVGRDGTAGTSDDIIQ